MIFAKSFKPPIHLRCATLFCFMLIFFIIALSVGCKAKNEGREKETSENTIWQKIQVVTAAGKALEIVNPEIDYSSSDGDAEDDESFGIRVLENDAITIIPWDIIKHIDMTADNKHLLATITTRDGIIMKVNLVQDAEKGLSGLSGSDKVSFHLREIKTIEVIQ